MQNKKSLMLTVVALSLVIIGFSSLRAETGENIITNGDFSDGLNNWLFETPGDLSVATADASTGELFVDIISDNGVNWRIRIFQLGLTLETGKEYTFSFDARADSARTIIAKVQKDQAPTTSSLHQIIAITDSMQNYSVTWTNEVETATYKAGFFLGADTFDVWIDNVVLVEKPAPNYTLSTNATNGFILLDPAGGSYPSGTVVTVTAIPDSGYEFSGWSGALSGLNNPDSITIVADTSLTANFSIANNLITNGDFFSGLDNWDFELPGGSSVATADASTGELYVDIILDSGTNWHIRLFQKGLTLETGKEYTFSFDARADSARTIIAKVQKDQAPTTSSLHQIIAITDSMQNYSVTWTNEVETATYKVGFFLGADTNDVWIDNIVLLAGPVTYCTFSTSAENGSISLDPAGGFYPNGTVVTVTAIPDSGYEFSEWSGALSGSNNPDSITIVSDTSLTAIFTQATGVVEETGINLPEKTELVQNYPNPFNPETTIPYRLSQPSQVKITIFNTLGQKVSTLVNKKQPAGYYSVKWHGKNDIGGQLTSGVYIYRLEADNFVQMKKFILLR